MLAKDLVAASSKPLVLSILADGESYGYEIIFQSRRRFVAVSLVAVLVLDLFNLLMFNLKGPTHASVSGFTVNNAYWTFPLIGLIAWLMPEQPQKIPQRA